MNIAKILTSSKTIFTLKDLELILGLDNQAVRNYLYQQKGNKVLKNIYSGIWGIEGKEYNKLELACKLRLKSYVSFETALQKHGVIFQDYSSIVTIASDNTISKNIDDIDYQYKKVKDSILLDPIGIDHYGTYTIASKERAICDIIYLKSGFSFDNLKSVDFEKLEEISKIYNKRTILEIKQLKNYA
ncbi:MAG: hypothetical protein PHZ26_05680 [Candidatus Gracilibacteria bacterium]|nr:hypothetical protein [Candidatus Gracilibacteria bacterium]MDD2909207.1 hypothetical protein [Candidatus Gracilibacteria bacterium]